jgi:exopolysaccharide production protein ExoZ
VLGGVLLERQGNLITPPWMVRLGDASYSIYLVHNPLLSVTSRLAGRLYLLTSWWFGMVVGVVVSVVIGVLYYKTIEKPLIRLFRKEQ